MIVRPALDTLEPYPATVLLSAQEAKVADFIEKTARSGKTLVVTNKPVRCALTGEDANGSLPTSGKYRGADIAHFGNLRGSNDFTEHEIAIILGRDDSRFATNAARLLNLSRSGSRT